MEPTEREKYIEKLQKDISKAVTAKRFKESDEGKLIQEWATEQINSIVKNIAGRKYINDHEGYVFETGQMFLAQKLLTMLNTEASKDTNQLADNLRAAQTDG